MSTPSVPGIVPPCGIHALCDCADWKDIVYNGKTYRYRAVRDKPLIYGPTLDIPAQVLKQIEREWRDANRG